MPTILGDTLEKIYDDFLDQLDRAMDDMADFVLDKADDNLRSGDFSPAKGKGAFDRGTLARSGRVERKRLKKRVIYDAPHAPFMEFGTRPHLPPLEPILGWVKRKVRVQATRGARRKRRTTDQEALKIANAIRWSIKKNGTLPRPFFRRAVDALTPAEIDRIVKVHTR